MTRGRLGVQLAEAEAHLARARVLAAGGGGRELALLAARAAMVPEYARLMASLAELPQGMRLVLSMRAELLEMARKRQVPHDARRSHSVHHSGEVLTEAAARRAGRGALPRRPGAPAAAAAARLLLTRLAHRRALLLGEHAGAAAGAAHLGLGCIVALCHRSSTSYQIR
jgi:hypothetical protein